MRSLQHVSIVTVGYFSVPDFPVVNDCFPFSWSGTLSSLIGNGLETHSCPRNSQRTTGQLFACCCSLPLKIYRPLLQRIKFAINLPPEVRRRHEERKEAYLTLCKGLCCSFVRHSEGLIVLH